MIKAGSVTAVIGGQFGSEGKGLLQGWLGNEYNFDVAVTSASANAGHTCVRLMGPERVEQKLVSYHLPMSGVVNDAMLVLGAGAVIDPVVLEKEIDALEKNLGIAPIRPRLWIHPRAVVIEPEDVALERDPNSSVTKIASTQHGVGAAMARRVRRQARLAADHPILNSYVRIANLNRWLRDGASVVLEIPQGLGLGLYSGLEYPYCTGREVSVAQGMSDAQLDPRFLDEVLMVIRTFPIRVGNIYNAHGEMLGHSGRFYSDSTELTWEGIGVPAEITTVTKRVRRVATFSFIQYQESVDILRPTRVMLNFANYLSEPNLNDLLHRMDKIWPVSFLGTGPRIDQVRRRGLKS